MKALIKIHSNPELLTIPDKAIMVTLGEPINGKAVVYFEDNPQLDWEETKMTGGVALIEGWDFTLVMTKE
ncbi:hypothetical protein VOWphi5012_080 [Vibrio phage phi50-12]|uniref:Uncharacterized protein n=1 Tax=Vibrio phage phi50-12 TaxID=2654972 RepID=A0A5P8PRD0_9CAUD|nr:hypothetical protein KNU82_gp080 [Vibrio phage phi50-12]QFR59864.1 hypothetical protein VOWphi5012_080 [Vibrio phage phi50-12]